jgi:hypothetical protein
MLKKAGAQTPAFFRAGRIALPCRWASGVSKFRARMLDFLALPTGKPRKLVKADVVKLVDTLS